jgi:hypothetical protein
VSNAFDLEALHKKVGYFHWTAFDTQQARFRGVMYISQPASFAAISATRLP